MSAPDQPSPPTPSGRRAPRGRGAYLWVIDHVPDHHEPALRDAATTVRHRRLRIRLFRERWIRRGKRTVRRSERAWQRRIRRLRQLQRRARRFVQIRIRSAASQVRETGRSENEATMDDNERRLAELAAWTPRRRITRTLFPATVQLTGTGPLVAIDATGHPTAAVIACQAHLPDRVIILTDSPHVGVLRAAGLPYEYLPAASTHHRAETVIERLLWLDYVYDIDRIESLDQYSDDSPD